MPLHPIAAAPTSLTAFVGISESGPFRAATHIASFAAYQAAFGVTAIGSEMGFAVNQFFANGGGGCTIVRIETIAARTFASAAAALDQAPFLNLLCLPGVTGREVLAAAALYCEKRRAFLIADSDPNANTPQLLLASMNHPPLLNAASLAIYGPWLQIPDPLNIGETRTVAPCGSIAGVYARNDSASGVWHAPAGNSARIYGASSPTFPISGAQGESLNAVGLNCIRQLPSIGIAPGERERLRRPLPNTCTSP